MKTILAAIIIAIGLICMADAADLRSTVTMKPYTWEYSYYDKGNLVTQTSMISFKSDGTFLNSKGWSGTWMTEGLTKIKLTLKHYPQDGYFVGRSATLMFDLKTGTFKGRHFNGKIDVSGKPTDAVAEAGK